MTRSEFFLAVEDEFGSSQGRSLLRDFVIDGLRNRTADEALAEGVAPKTVWYALCEAMQVPPHRWHGAGLADPALATPMPDTPA